MSSIASKRVVSRDEQVSSNLDELSPLWERIERMLSAFYGGQLEHILLDLRLAITEGVVNAIIHAHNEDGRPVGIQLELSEENLTVEIKDTGPGFEWSGDQDNGVDLDAESGRGLFLMKSLMSDVTYQQSRGSNILTLVRNVPKVENTRQAKVKKRRVLVADDDPDLRFLMTRMLEKSNCEVIAAEDGEQALQYLRNEANLDAALIDVMMPKLSGLEVVSEYRADPKHQFVPILLITAKDSSEDVTHGFEAGADDYIVKPPISHVLKARINAAFRIKDMAYELHQGAERLRGQLREARTLQQAVLPSPFLNSKHVKFCSLFRPCDYVGGDMVNYFNIDEDNVGFYIADISGHGVAAAMFSMWLNRILQPLPTAGGIVKRSVKGPPYYEIVPPDDVCGGVDKLMGEGEDDKYLTIFYGVLTISTGELLYCSAGHPMPLLVNKVGQAIPLEGGSPPIGLNMNFEFRTHRKMLSPGDRLIVYSDCAIEAKSPANEEFGRHRLAGVLSHQHRSTPNLQLQAVLDALREYTEVSTFDDDLTLLSVAFRGGEHEN